MKKIGITGSLASGKTTASKILSSGRGPLFSADSIVKKLYQKKILSNFYQKNLKLIMTKTKKKINKYINKKPDQFKKIEKIIHPLVRKEMINLQKNKNSQLYFMKYLFN